eukprot:COSAG01_NODE_23360_length_818_cov_1.036161_2_plen_23_part_01
MPTSLLTISRPTNAKTQFQMTYR